MTIERKPERQVDLESSDRIDEKYIHNIQRESERGLGNVSLINYTHNITKKATL